MKLFHSIPHWKGIKSMATPESFLVTIINEINKAIDFATPINAHAKNLEKELRTYSKELCLDDKKILKKSTWKFLREGEYIDHVPQEDTKTHEEVKHKKKAKSTANTLKQLTHVAQNLNRVLGLSPPIQVSNDVKLLFSHVKEAAMEVYREDEEPFDDDAWEYLQQNELIAHLNITQTKETDEETKPKEAKEQSEYDTPIKKKKRKTKKPGKERLARIEELIEEGLHTNSQIAVIVEKEFDMYALSGTLALISNAKNPKYTKFQKLAITDPITKRLSFEDQ